MKMCDLKFKMTHGVKLVFVLVRHARALGANEPSGLQIPRLDFPNQLSDVLQALKLIDK